LVPEHNTAAIYFRTRGGIGNKNRGYLIRQNVVALHAIVDAIVSVELEAVDPNRWWELPWATYDYGDWGYQENSIMIENGRACKRSAFTFRGV
jgi:hypothetical protein